MSSNLPIYHSEATPEQAAARDIWRQRQESLIENQRRDDVPMEHVKIRCGCRRMVPWEQMHRCLYCRVWFCLKCGQEHFGYRVEV